MAWRIDAPPERCVFPHHPDGYMKTGRSPEDPGSMLGQWNSLVRRARIGRERKIAALVVSSYADAEGRDIRLSVARYAVDLEVSYSTARRYLTWLRKVGLLEMTRAGNRRKNTASEYRLILGADVMEQIEVLSPSRQKALADEMREAERKGTQARSTRMRTADQRSPEMSVDNDADEPDSDPINAHLGRALIDPINAQMARDQRSPLMTYTPSRTHLSVDDQPSRADGDLEAAVTASRASADLPNPLRSARCPDGLSAAMRPDGKPECPICRRRQTRPGIEVPPPEGHLAPVVDFFTREAI